MKALLTLFSLLFFAHVSFTQNKMSDEEIWNITFSKSFDTINVDNEIYPYFEEGDMNGFVIKRDSLNQKPCFIYHFMSHCAPCTFEIPMINQLYDEFSDKMDFIAFTPIPKESLFEIYPESEAYKFPIISVPRSYIKTGFPMAYILKMNNKIILTRLGGTGPNDFIRTKHYQKLKSWCKKAIADK